MVLIINELSSYLHIIYYYQDGENPPACFVWSAGVVSRGRRAWMKIICPIRNDSLDFFFLTSYKRVSFSSCIDVRCLLNYIKIIYLVYYILVICGVWPRTEEHPTIAYTSLDATMSHFYGSRCQLKQNLTAKNYNSSLYYYIDVNKPPSLSLSLWLCFLYPTRYRNENFTK